MVDCKSKFGYTPNLTFTLEQHLKNFAECEENARRLLESFHIIREKMQVGLRPIMTLFPHYSEHGQEHSEHIISAIEGLLGKDRIIKLSPAETWMILVCAYMHDLGMLVQGKELKENWKTKEFQEHIKSCMESQDQELKHAALNVISSGVVKGELNWPVDIYRDVILLASEFYRKKHPERVKDLPHRAELKQLLNVIMSNDGKLPPRIQDVVGKICSSHGTSFEQMLNILEPTDSLMGYVFHPRFIASMICLGDLCDLDNGRFNEMAIEVFGGLTKSNLIHYFKHESVSSFVIEKDKISVIFDIPNKKIKHTLQNMKSAPVNMENADLQDFCDQILVETQNWLSWMEDIVKNIKLFWDRFSVGEIDALSPALDYKILIDGKETISSKRNMRFTFSNDKAYELIEGYNLYNNKYIFIRELLQNSIDALKIQFWKDLLAGRWNHLLKHLENDGEIDYSEIQPFDFSDKSVFDYYQVKIYVNHTGNDQVAKFVIEDNGTGISKEDVANRIIKTGSRELKYDNIEGPIPEWLKPTSAFGIGLHSVFAVTEKLFALTKTETDKNVYNINMHSGKLDGYVFMSFSEQQNQRFCNCAHGTRMEFLINVPKCFENQGDIFRDHDPLEERPESDFCRSIQVMLTNVLESSLFKVSYEFNSDKEITCVKFCDDCYMGLLFKNNRRNTFLGEQYKYPNYDFALDISGRYLVLWNRLKAVAMLYEVERERETNCKVSCKGFRVNNARIVDFGYKTIPERVEYWGGNTKDILNVARDSLSRKQLAANKTLFTEARSIAAQIYYALLSIILKDNMIEKWHDDISEFMEPWMKKKCNSIDTKKVSESLELVIGKYSNLLITTKYIKILILRHGFCLLLKFHKNLIQEFLNALDIKNRINYIFNFDIYKNEQNNEINEQTYVSEYIEFAFHLFEEDDMLYTYNMFMEIFKAEFSNEYINKKKQDLFIMVEKYDFLTSGNETFGEVYVSKSLSVLSKYIYGFSLQNEKYFKKESENYNPIALDIYLTIPITYMIYLIICAGQNILPLRNLCSKLFSYIPGYENAYGFINANNVMDILTSSNLVIKEKDFSELLLEYFPFLYWLPCELVNVNEEGELMLQFNGKYEENNPIQFQNNSFSKLLYAHHRIQWIPIPAGYEKIAIKKMGVYSTSSSEYHDEVLFYRNFATYLWDDFENISQQYKGRIVAGEDIEVIVNEIMPKSRNDNSNKIVNLLRFIYHNRANESDLSFEEEWDDIHSTYCAFVTLVLSSISMDVVN